MQGNAYRERMLIDIASPLATVARCDVAVIEVTNTSGAEAFDIRKFFPLGAGLEGDTPAEVWSVMTANNGERMSELRFFALVIALTGAFAVAHTASAQNGEHPTQMPNPRILRREGGPMQRVQGQSLSDILDKLDWDPAARGTLLIVSPEETTHYLENSRPMTPEAFRLSQAPPEAEANGQYRLAQMAPYYNRRVVNLPTVSVFAPATMAILNTTHLPKPDAYVGMSSADKARLLESTFTPDQWRQMSSPEGIGASDMKKEQRDIFLSMLPQPFVVLTPGMPTVDDTGVSRPGPSTRATLSEDQRENVRISLARKLDWSYNAGPNMTIRSHSADASAPLKPRLLTSPANTESTSDVFGVSLVENVPSHLKASQLPDDWQALEKTVSLDTAATVGDLVKRISTQTSAELYCDPRYEDRKLYIRGTSAKASDLCKALAWGVTGTWRRLGEAFVLTDDLVGLGARHAVIDNWIRENTLLAQFRQSKIEAALAESHFGDYLQWDADDPLKPSDSLKAKIDGYQKAALQDKPDSLIVQPTELSPAAQEQIRRDGAQQGTFVTRSGDGTVTRHDLAAQSSSVYLSVITQPTYVIPGGIRVAANDITVLASPQVVVDGSPSLARRFAFSGANAMPPTPLALTSTLANRVLLIGPSADADMVKLAQAAHARGFTELWVSANRGDTAAVQSAVKAGAAKGLIVQAVVPLTRPAPPGKPELLECNILGETLTDYAKRWRRQLDEIGFPQESGTETYRFSAPAQDPINSWRKSVLVDAILRGGDFLRCDVPAVVTQVSGDVKKIAAVHGLSGIVFCDTAAPGFSAPIAPGFGSGWSDRVPGDDPVLTMGYSDETRLACLRKNGFDPIDVSPLADGDHFRLSSTQNHAGQPPQMSLPFFADSGTRTRDTMFDGPLQTTNTSQNAWQRWCAFRQDLDARFVGAVSDAVHAESPNLPIMTRRPVGPLDDVRAYFGSLEGPTLSSDPSGSAPTAAPASARGGQPRNIRLEAAHSASRISYTSAKYSDVPGSDSGKDWFVGNLTRILQQSIGWDGIVIDLTEASPTRALELLSLFQPEPRPAVAQAN